MGVSDKSVTLGTVGSQCLTIRFNVISRIPCLIIKYYVSIIYKLLKCAIFSDKEKPTKN